MEETASPWTSAVKVWRNNKLRAPTPRASAVSNCALAYDAMRRRAITPTVFSMPEGRAAEFRQSVISWVTASAIRAVVPVLVHSVALFEQ